MQRSLPVLMLAAATIIQPASAQDRARLRLVSETDTLVPGTTAWLGFAFDLDPDWHLYWNGANDTGFPIKITPELPAGFEIGEMVWPVPHRHVSPGDLLDHIYEKRVTLLLPVKVPTDARPGSKVKFAASGEWLVCKSACIAGSAEVSLTLPVATPGSKSAATQEAALFKEARENSPRALKADQPEVRVIWTEEGAKLEVVGGKKAAFYPATDCSPIKGLIESGITENGVFNLSFEKPGAGDRLEGVVHVDPQSGGKPTVYSIRAARANPPGSGASNPPVGK
jgi:DsbC/DsbD-like thiol-disulfide interchange protein